MRYGVYFVELCMIFDAMVDIVGGDFGPADSNGRIFLKKIVSVPDEGFTDVSDGSFDKFMDLLKAKKETYLQETRRLRSEFDDRETAVQAQIDQVRDSKTKLEQTQVMKSKQIVSEHTTAEPALVGSDRRFPSDFGNCLRIWSLSVVTL